MSHKHKVNPSETGLLRIFLKPSDRSPRAAGLRGFFGSRPFYRDLVDAAKNKSFINAVAYNTHCVELVGKRPNWNCFAVSMVVC